MGVPIEVDVPGAVVGLLVTIKVVRSIVVEVSRAVVGLLVTREVVRPVVVFFGAVVGLLVVVEVLRLMLVDVFGTVVGFFVTVEDERLVVVEDLPAVVGFFASVELLRVIVVGVLGAVVDLGMDPRVENEDLGWIVVVGTVIFLSTTLIRLSGIGFALPVVTGTNAEDSPGVVDFAVDLGIDVVCVADKVVR